MTCAVVNKKTGIIQNRINASADDLWDQPNSYLVDIPDNFLVGIGYTYDGKDFFDFDGNVITATL
jgi:hypothetical protein